MDKRILHHAWTIIRPINPVYMAVGLVAAATITGFALRQNNLTMVQLRDDVYQADKQNKDVEGALYRLRSHVYGHMNTDLSSGESGVYPPIQLKYTYERLKQAEKKRVKKATANVYTRAQTHCEQLYPDAFSGRTRVPCIQKYVASHKVTEKEIPDAMYKFDFVSPRWSPDLAGFSAAITTLLAVGLLARVVGGLLLKGFSK